MKKLLYLVFAIALASCSSQKYAANFNYYKSNSGYAGGYHEVATDIKTTTSIMAAIEPAQLEASVVASPTAVVKTKLAPSKVLKTYAQMNKSERKALRSEIKKEIKNSVKIQKVTKVQSGNIDHDLKLAAIFGAVGVVGLIIYTSPFNIIGAIALIIGVVFFVKWLVRQ